jgi:hypothetical protein
VIEEAGPFKAEVVLKVRADFPTTITANMVILRVPLPKTTTRYGILSSLLALVSWCGLEP